ncbi:MAG: GntR family transcriptional regulator [Oscillospiraceae bacterium]
MRLQVSTLSQIPIYEQLKQQLREQIFSGALAPEAQLPSIRMLAKELKIGVITAKRAYDDLCDEGILVSRAGVGVFVARLDLDRARLVQREQLREQLAELKQTCDAAGIAKKELLELLDEIYKEEQEG